MRHRTFTPHEWSAHDLALVCGAHRIRSTVKGTRKEPLSLGQKCDMINDLRGKLQIECYACLEKFTARDRAQFTCNHLVECCPPCLIVWFRAESASNNINMVNCPIDDCGWKLDLDDIEKCVAAEDFAHARVLYLAAACGGFVCPTEDCEELIAGNDFELTHFVTCGGCRHQICVSCHSEWHSGVLCKDYQDTLTQQAQAQAQADAERRAMEEWQAEVQRQAEAERRIQVAAEEQASTGFVEQHTQTCPGCQSPIQKSSGCDHMTCCKWQKHDLRGKARY
jgi:hypothetical protein